MGGRTWTSRAAGAAGVLVLVMAIAAAAYYGGNPLAVALVPIVVVHALYLAWAWRPSGRRAFVGVVLAVGEVAFGIASLGAGPGCRTPPSPGAAPCGPPIGTVPALVVAGSLLLLGSLASLPGDDDAREP